MFANQFSRNSILNLQGKYPPTIRQVAPSITEILVKHRTIQNILNGLNLVRARKYFSED